MSYEESNLSIMTKIDLFLNQIVLQYPSVAILQKTPQVIGLFAQCPLGKTRQ